MTQRIILLFLKRLATLVFVSNPLDRDFLLKKGFRPSQVLVTFGGVDFNSIPKKKLPIKYEASWVGRLHAQKGIDDLFLSWKKIIETFPKAKLAIVGEPDIKKYFLNQPYSKGLAKNVFFTGYLESDKKFLLLKSCKISLCPSYYESFGMVIAEAMAAGLPVIAYDLPIYKKIYEDSLLVCPIGDINSYSKNIIELLKNERKRESLAKKSKKIAQKFQWDYTANRILEKL